MQITEKLYENNSLLKECWAKVLSCNKKDKGYEIMLDRTVIFPEGGGQPSDKGWIDGTIITYASEKDGQVFHYCNEEITVGSEVLVKLDWARRLDQMQQHCGEHLLSYAFWKLFGANNIGFHMNEQSVFVDLDKEISPEEVMQAEDFVNTEIWENKPITVSYISSEDLTDSEMRKKNENIKGILRIVSVERGDSCTCCGTHPPATGMVGTIKVIGFDRHRGGMRIEFVCGRRALLDARRKHEAISETNALLSVKPEEVPAAVRKLKEELSEITVRLKNRTLELYQLRKEGILANASTGNDGSRLVLVAEEECTAKEAKLFAQVLVNEEQMTAGIFYRVGERMNYVFMSSAGGRDCKLLCQRVNQLLGGKGGGNESFAQGSAAYTSDWRIKLTEIEKTLLLE
ncbi:MAG: DHHA1 domain-containing protein [Acidaminococcaceae bacterium]